MIQLNFRIKNIHDYFDRWVETDWFLPCLGLVAVSALFLLVNMVSNFSSIIKATSKKPVVLSTMKQTRAVDYQQIAKSHLFGDAVAGLGSTYLPTTTMQLTLEGIFWEPNQKQREALIANSNGVAKEYHTGDSLPGNASIVKITANDVIIRKNGNYEKIEMPNNTLHFDTKTTTLFGR